MTAPLRLRARELRTRLLTQWAAYEATRCPCGAKAGTTHDCDPGTVQVGGVDMHPTKEPDALPSL